MEISDDTITELQHILVAANQGDDHAFNELLLRFESRLRSLTQRMLRNYPRLRRWEQTDDVFQKSLIRLHRSLTSAKPDSVRAFIGLAATQVRRTLIDMGRHYFGVHGQGAKHQSAGGGRAADDPGGQLEAAGNFNAKEPVSLEQWTEFHEATAQLPEEIRETFSLIWYAGLQQMEVASILKVSNRTIIRRMNEARRLLHESLAAPSISTSSPNER